MQTVQILLAIYFCQKKIHNSQSLSSCHSLVLKHSKLRLAGNRRQIGSIKGEQRKPVPFPVHVARGGLPGFVSVLRENFQLFYFPFCCWYRSPLLQLTQLLWTKPRISKGFSNEIVFFFKDFIVKGRCFLLYKPSELLIF
jgi:hypothetical protein